MFCLSINFLLGSIEYRELSQAQYSRVILASYCALMKTVCTYTLMSIRIWWGFDKQTIAFDRQMFVVFLCKQKTLFCRFVIKSTTSCNK